MNRYEKSCVTLELPAVLELLSAEASSDGAKERCRALAPSDDRREVLRRLADKYSFFGHGIDAEEKMLEQERRKCPDMQILCCSCDYVPFDDGSFDIVIACMAYHHFPDKDSFSKECSRLLRSGGRLYIADPRLPLPVRKALNTVLEIHRINGRVYTADEMAENFSQYGFEKVYDKHEAYAQLVCLEKK